MSDWAKELAQDIRGGQWPEPIPLVPVQRPPTFPAHRMPPWVADYVAAVAEFLQVPIDLPAMLCLSALATAAGGRVVVEPWPGWREPTNLYVAVAMNPGERKTPVFLKIIHPLEHAERIAVEVAKPEVIEARIRAQVAKAKADQADRQAETSSEDARDEAIHFAQQMRLMAEAVTVPHIPRMLADDCTPESLASLMCEQGGRIALFSDEGEVFGMIAGRYGTGGPNMGVYLKAHTGSPIRVDRKGRDAEYIERPAMTLGLTIQPEVLRFVSNVPGARGRGLLGRFLWSVPGAMVGHRRTSPVPAEVPEAIELRYHEYVVALVSSLSEWTDPAVLVMLPAAAERLRAFQAAIEPRLGEHGDLAGIVDWAAKLVGHTVRIAGLLHLATKIDAGWANPIEASTVDDAIKVAEYLIDHARIAFDEMRLDPLLADARHVLEWVTAQETFSRRDFHRRFEARFPTVADAQPVLDLLVDHAYIAERTPSETRPKRGRPASTKYAVNPRSRNGP